jgi:beta-galactosidase GanA
VQIVCRKQDGKRYYFVLNFMETERTITLHRPMKLLYTGEEHNKERKLKPFETAVYEVL